LKPVEAGSNRLGSAQYSVSDSSPVCIQPLGNPDQTHARVEPVVFAGFVLTGGKTWDLTESIDAALATSFPEMDRRAQYAKASGWLVANPAKRKTAKGMARFLFNWLERAQNRGHGTPANGVPMREARSAGNLDVLQRWAERKAAL
jgi:hypothetical protein